MSTHIVGTLWYVGVKNYLIEGVSGTGKTSVCDELQRRGYQAIHGDRELAYQGDPETGEPTGDFKHENHIWYVDRVKTLVASQDEAVTFFCGGSRNFAQFIDLVDDVFVLEVDLETLNRRLDQRPQSEWGGKPAERELIWRLHQTKEDLPKNAISIDATATVAHVVDEILRHCERRRWQASETPRPPAACPLLLPTEFRARLRQGSQRVQLVPGRSFGRVLRGGEG